ncbi:MAG: hypothetical protein RLZZ253_3077 [Verrucomicrobiota bacterium]
MIMRNLIFIFLLSASLPGLQAQPSRALSSSEIHAGIQRLKVLGSVLYVAAHPDDENTRLLACLARERHLRTGYLSLTRGDGGQNLIGDEQGIELGLIRTQELLAARRIDGAEQFFTRAFDFGFSKSTDEALKTWGREKILSDVVWVIRKFQPDVIVTRFPEDARAGHGHHSASGVLAREAFIAAADPNRFKEHFALGVKPWQAKRILWNTFNFGGNNTTSGDQFKMDVGGWLPLPVLVMLLVFALCAVLLHRTRFGQHLFAIGGNREAARFTGISIRFHELIVYALCGFCAGVAGMIHCSQLFSAEPSSGQGFELNAIAAVVVGGTSFSGGIGSMTGTLLGAVIIGILDKGLNQAGVHFSLQYLVKGAVILGAVWLDVRRRGSR